MTQRAERAVSLFEEGFSCSQAVLAQFSDLFGLDRRLALKISQPFGGGIAHRGETCGAVSGAFLVIGMKFGRTEVEDLEAREKTYEKINEFIDRFSAAHGSILCRDLLGVNLSEPGVHEKAEEEKLFDSICRPLIQSSIEILEEIL
jgi:C_GCAxxG_C_C family probable redox protein